MEDLIEIPCSRNLLRNTASRDTQQQRGLRLVAVGVSEDVRKENAFHVLDAIGVERVRAALGIAPQ